MKHPIQITNAITVNFQRYIKGIDRNFMVLMALKTMPSGLSCKNSNAAVSFSINVILIYNSNSVTRQSNRKSNLLSAAKNDLVSCSWAMLINEVLGVEV